MKTIETRDYQIESVAKTVDALQSLKKALIVMATGLGKTITCGFIIEEFFRGVDTFKVLYLCDKSLALSQAEEAFLDDINLDVHTAKMYGSNQSLQSSEQSIVFASFQKMTSANEWMKQFDPNHFDLVVVDEAHHGYADTYYSVIRYFTKDETPLLGMTATPYRSDQKDIKALFGKPVVDISLEEGIVMGWLADLDYQIISDDINEDVVKQIVRREVKGSRRPTFKSLNQTLFIKKRDDEIAKHIKLHSLGNKKTLIFCQSITHANEFAKLLGERARRFHSDLTKTQNDENLESFKEGDTKYLLVVDKLNEAFDMPEVEMICFLRVTGSKRIFFQQLGRGLRKTETKKKVIVLDFVANCERLIELASLSMKLEELSDPDSVLDREDENVLKRFLGRNHPGNMSRMKPFFRVNGDHFDFRFTEKTLRAIEFIEVISKGYYPTLEEAREACRSISIFNSVDYFNRNKNTDLRLPGDPTKHYQECKNWDDFFQKELPPNKFWRTANSLQKELSAASDTIINFSEDYRKPYPEWFKVFWAGRKYAEHFSPQLVKKIKDKFPPKIEWEEPLENWMTRTEITLELHKKKKDLKHILNKYRDDYPEWFRKFKKYGKGVEHLAPELISIIREYYKNK